MNNLQKILGIGACVAGIGITGCFDEEKPIQYTTVKGKPLAVSVVEGHYGYGTIACVVEADNKKILASAGNYLSYLRARAAALIQSEINDGDNDLVTLIGESRGDLLYLKSIEANGYKIEF